MKKESSTSTSDKIWSILEEVSVSQKELSDSQRELSDSQKETDEQIKRFSAEIAASQKELSDSQKELSASQKETEKQIKTLTEKTDKQIETLSAGMDKRNREMDHYLETLTEKTDKQIETLSVEMDKRNRETDHYIETLSAEMDKRSRQTDRHIQKIGGRFNQRWGALVESLVEGNLVKIFQARGIDISQTHTRSVARWKKPDGSFQEREFDIIVANGTEVVEVEVKTSLDLRDVKSFVEKIRDFKRYFPRYRTETVYGAVAYLKSEGEAHSYAEDQGLFVIRATGDSASLVNREDFKPKTFA